VVKTKPSRIAAWIMQNIKGHIEAYIVEKRAEYLQQAIDEAVRLMIEVDEASGYRIRWSSWVDVADQIAFELCSVMDVESPMECADTIGQYILFQFTGLTEEEMRRAPR